jgi:hypothetical protein
VSLVPASDLPCVSACLKELPLEHQQSLPTVDALARRLQHLALGRRTHVRLHRLTLPPRVARWCSRHGTYLAWRCASCLYLEECSAHLFYIPVWNDPTDGPICWDCATNPTFTTAPSSPVP